MRIDYDKMADVFDDTRYQDPQLVGAVALGVLAIAGKGEKVLDIGTGTGRFLKPIADAGMEAYGLDISKNMLRKAGEKGLMNLVRGDATRLPFANLSFKASLVTNVLHLVSGWKELMQEACRVSRRAVMAVDIGRDEDDPINIFKSIMKESGLGQPRAGPLETELADQCPAECRIRLGEYDESRTREELLSTFDMRTFTFQSEMTEQQHRRCMEEFARRLKAETIVAKHPIALIVWEPAELRAKIPKTTFCYPHGTTF